VWTVIPQSAVVWGLAIFYYSDHLSRFRVNVLCLRKRSQFRAVRIAMRLSFRLSASFLLVGVFALCAFGLKCNSCSSSISFEDCFNQRETVGVHCDEDYKCGKSHYKYKRKDVYSLSCVSITHCNSPSDMCHANQQMSDCEVTCCGEDLCNATSIPMASVFSVSVCLVGTFIMCLQMGW